MKDAKHKIDDLFSRSFEGYTVEPSASVWNNIVHKYFTSGIYKTGLLSIQNMLSIVLIVGAGILVQYGFLPADKNNTTEIKPNIENTLVSNPVPTNPTTETPDVIATNELKNSETINNNISPNISNPKIAKAIISSEVKTQGTSNTSSQNTQAEPTINKTLKENQPPVSEYSSEDQSDQNVDITSLMSLPLILEGNKYTSYASLPPLLAERNKDTDIFSNLSEPRTGENLMGAKYNKLLKISKREKDYFKKAHISYRNKYSQIPVQWNNDYLFRSPWALGLLYGHEWIYYPGDSTNKKNANSIELAAIYQKDLFILRSGIGVSVSNDNGEYVINYETNDSTGFYYGINSFTIDPDNPDTPIFDTYVETVFDSVEHTSYVHPDNKYTYLQIPLLIGYKVLNVNRFSCSLMGGPVLSLLIHEDEQTAQFSDIDATLINIENNTPTRLKTSWQFMFSAGLNYRVANHLNITLEPTYKYYIKSVYEYQEAGTKNPWSMGLRGGVVYTF